jgi:hypothetical protein
MNEEIDQFLHLWNRIKTDKEKMNKLQQTIGAELNAGVHIVGDKILTIKRGPNGWQVSVQRADRVIKGDTQ